MKSINKLTNLSKTLYQYFNSFVPAYLENSVPSEATYPYITYTLNYDEYFGDSLIQVRIWTKSTSVTQVVGIADKMGSDIGTGKLLDCVEGGTLWLKAGSPFQQFISDDDITIKSIYMNIIMNYLV